MLTTDSDTHVLEDRRIHGDQASPRRIARGPWTSVLRVGILAAGLLFTVAAGVALLRSIPIATVTGPHVTVGWWHHTPGLALIHLALGIALLTVGSYRPAARELGPGTALFLGALSVVWGLITVIGPAALHPALGTHTIHGVTYVTMGTMLIAYDLGTA